MTELQNNPTKPCHYAHRHMTMAEYGFYNLCIGLSKSSGILTYSIRHLAALFASTSPATVHRFVSSFVERGWFEIVRESKFNPAKKHGSPIHYRVLEHAEWSEKYPDRCEKGVPPGVQGVPPGVQGVPPGVQGVPPGVHKANTKLSSNQKLASSAPLSNLTQELTERSSQFDGGVPPGVHDVSTQTFIGSPDPIPSPDLVAMVEGRMHFSQKFDGIDPAALALVHKVPIPVLEVILNWALDEPFWMTRIMGSRALRSFVKSFPTIKQQMAREKKQKSSAATLKAASVQATPEFKYRSKPNV